MLRYKTETRPGLVALYDIRPGNGAGQFLQPRSPHGAVQYCKWRIPKLGISCNNRVQGNEYLHLITMQVSSKLHICKRQFPVPVISDL